MVIGSDMSNRIDYLDIAKGFGIFLIVLGHNNIPIALYNWLYSFHVPLFFIISGFLYRNQTPGKTIEKGFRQLLLPVLITIFVTAGGLFLLFFREGIWKGPNISHWITELILMNGKEGVCGMWFVVALFWGKLWYSLVQKLGDWWILLIGSILFILGYYCRMNFHLPFHFDNGMAVLLYLFVGKQISRYDIMRYDSNWFVIILSLFFLSIASYYPINMFQYWFRYDAWSILTSIVLCLSFLFVIKRFCCYDSLFKKIFVFVGQNTLLILCMHGVLHTWQVHRVLDVFPPLCFAIIECIILALAAMVLNRIPCVYRIFHGGKSK